MTPDRDYDTPVRLLPVFQCDAAAGQPVPPDQVGGLKTEGRLLPTLAATGVPTLECTLHFPSGAATFDGLTVAGMVLGVVTALSDAEKALGGTGLEPRESRVSAADRTLTLRLTATLAVGAAERLRALSTAFAAEGTDPLAARLKRACPAAARFVIAA